MLATWLREGGTVEQLIEGLKFPGVDQKRLAGEMQKSKHSEYNALFNSDPPLTPPAYAKFNYC